MRATLLVICALATGLLVAGCGGSNDQTTKFNGQTLTVPSDVHGVYGELEALLAQFPYQRWYTRCVVGRVKKELSPAEAEALEQLPESKRAGKAQQIIAAAGPACEKSTRRPLLDPNASEKELDLFRSSFVAPLRRLAERSNLDAEQVACVEEGIEGLPGVKVVALGNGSHKTREGILLSVIKPCAQAK